MSAVRIVALATALLSMASPLRWVSAPPPQPERPVVVLSPGHGWRVGEDVDPGATSGSLVEKDINLDVARHARTYLERCGIDVRLTRNGDDFTHELGDVAEIVNGHDPALAVSIHTNSGEGDPSGAEAWYTVGGHDDAASQALAAQLSQAVASHMGIRDRGAKPETDSARGGLYIHDWEAPSALVEIGFLQGDAELLRNRRREFGRAIAQAIVATLGRPLTCADHAKQEGLAVATYFPGDSSQVEVRLVNDGLSAWTAGDYALRSVSGEYCDAASYPVPADTAPGAECSWTITLDAPTTPGVYTQAWQVARAGEPFDQRARAYIIVVPERARELRQEIDAQIAEARRAGEEAVNEVIEDVRRRAVEWVTTELPDLICGQVGALLGGAAGIVVLREVRRRR